VNQQAEGGGEGDDTDDQQATIDVRWTDGEGRAKSVDPNRDEATPTTSPHAHRIRQRVHSRPRCTSMVWTYCTCPLSLIVRLPSLASGRSVFWLRGSADVHHRPASCALRVASAVDHSRTSERVGREVGVACDGWTRGVDTPPTTSPRDFFDASGFGETAWLDAPVQSRDGGEDT
jgi:hypothetical protein